MTTLLQISISSNQGISMSSNYLSDRHHPQALKPTSFKSFIANKNKLASLAGYVLIIGGLPIMLSGCQSTPASTKKANTSTAFIDFSIADTSQNQAQGRAFTASLSANDQRYQQLFDQSKYPNTENQAKLRLLSAIRQHLATEHVAVAQANYQLTPFIKSDSIDAGSTGLLRTIIELYAFRNSNTEEDSYDNYDDYSEAEEAVAEAATEAVDAAASESENCNTDESDDAYEVCYVEDASDAVMAVDEVAVDYASDSTEYDEDGYDEYGYDEEGYDRDGYNEYGNQRGYEDTEDYSDSDSSMLSKMKNINPKSLSKDYEAMQIAKKQATANANNSAQSSAYQGLISRVLDMFHKTPDQVNAANEYQYKYLTFNSVSQYKPKQRQFQSVYSYNYEAPTISSSIQIPLAMDFNNSRLTIDPSAIMPIVALVNPEHTPLPTQMASHRVDFGLPENITSQLPSAVLYDAAINAVQDSMAELAPEYFSAIDIRNDAFAKKVGADKAVKVYFGSKQSGEMIGKIFKHMSQSLHEYVDANPEKYPDGAKLKTAIDKLQLYNKGYQSADIGSLIQLIEAVGPISFNPVNYYYLDSSDRLIAKQQSFNIGGDLMGSQILVANQIRYDAASFNQHALMPLLAESFGPNATPAIDGNAWIKEQRQQKSRLREARYAREDYDNNVNETQSDYAQNDVEDAYDTEYSTDVEDMDLIDGI